MTCKTAEYPTCAMNAVRLWFSAAVSISRINIWSLAERCWKAAFCCTAVKRATRSLRPTAALNIQRAFNFH